MKITKPHYKSKPKTYSKYQIYPDGTEKFIKECTMLPEQAEQLNREQPAQAKAGSLAKYEYRLKNKK